MPLAFLVADPTSPLGSFPADPVRFWAVVGASVLVGVFPLILARIQAKKADRDEQTKVLPVLLGESATPRVDATADLLRQMVTGLEKRVEHADQRYVELERRSNEHYADLERKYYQLMEKYVTSTALLEKAQTQVHELSDEVHLLRGRLMGGGHV